MSEITPPHDSPPREAGRILRWAAAILTAPGIVLVVAGSAFLAVDWTFLLWAPWVVIVALIAAGLVGWNLRSRRVAWALIVVAGAECCCALALLGRQLSDERRQHARHVRNIEALGGMHGESRGVSFDIRPVQGDRHVEMRVALAGVTLRSRPEFWDVHCYTRDVHVYFGGPHGTHATASGATLDQSFSSSASPREHLPPFCSLQVSTAWGGDEEFSVWAPLRR